MEGCIKFVPSTVLAEQASVRGQVVGGQAAGESSCLLPAPLLLSSACLPLNLPLCLYQPWCQKALAPASHHLSMEKNPHILEYKVVGKAVTAASSPGRGHSWNCGSPLHCLVLEFKARGTLPC